MEELKVTVTLRFAGNGTIGEDEANAICQKAMEALVNHVNNSEDGLAPLFYGANLDEDENVSLTTEHIYIESVLSKPIRHTF